MYALSKWKKENMDSDLYNSKQVHFYIHNFFKEPFYCELQVNLDFPSQLKVLIKYNNLIREEFRSACVITSDGIHQQIPT